MHSASHHDGPLEAGSRGQDPCLQIQVDLSAMLDGELDPAGVRRVTVHSDVCPTCKAFFDGIREQVGIHRRLVASQSVVSSASPETDADGAAAADGDRDQEAAALGGLRRQLTDNQRKLSSILYELGRNFALMGLSPEFSREVAREPMPMPDVAMRGRNLLDEVARSDENGPEWVSAKDLFDGRLRTPEENLARGQRLLTECLALDPAREDARIYLGLVHYARGQRSLARKQFRVVLEHSKDTVMRGFAMSNLSNIYLDEGDCDAAVALLDELVGSEALDKQPRLVAALFNLALAHGLKGSFSECLRWFGKLKDAAPHRRHWVANELSRRSHFLHLVHTHPDATELAERIPEWFPARRPGKAC